MAILSMRKYAELRGCSAMAVSLAVKDKRLINSVVWGANGKPTGINAEIANQEWAANTNHSMVPISQPTKKAKPSLKTIVEEQYAERAPKVRAPAPNTPTIRGAKPAETEQQASFAPPNVGTEAENFAASRAKREAYAAEIARLDFEERQGTLVDAEKVKKEAFRVARIVRDSMLNIADRIAPELAGITDSFEIHARVTKEIREALQGLEIAG